MSLTRKIGVLPSNFDGVILEFVMMSPVVSGSVSSAARTRLKETGRADGRARPGGPCCQVELLYRSRVLRRLCLCLFGAVVAADDDLFAADFDFDSVVLDVPIAHGALFGLHE